jgi:hypothetical protein
MADRKTGVLKDVTQRKCPGEKKTIPKHGGYPEAA